MKSIAISLLLIFLSSIAVLSTYHLWQDADFQVSISIEEEEEGNLNETVDSLEVLFCNNDVSFRLISIQQSNAFGVMDVNNNYEDVCLKTHFSPPDVM